MNPQIRYKLTTKRLVKACEKVRFAKEKKFREFYWQNLLKSDGLTLQGIYTLQHFKIAPNNLHFHPPKRL